MVLNQQQATIVQMAIDSTLHSSEQVFEFTGDAGTGKSVVLNAIREGLGLGQNEILALAPTGQAAIVMRTKGFPFARSIHSALFHFEEQVMYDSSGNVIMDPYYNVPKMRREFVPKKSIDKNIKVMFIDEGRMVADYLKPVLLQHGIKLIVAGDKNQLGPVKAQPAFICSDNIPRLTELVRQSANDPIVYLAHKALRGEYIPVGLYGNNVLVIEEKDLNDGFLANADIVICGTNKTRDAMNRHIREDIKGIHSELPVYGDRMICRKNNWGEELDGISLANGLVGTVVSSPDMTCFDGKTYHISFKPDLLSNAFGNLTCDYQYLRATPPEREVIKNYHYYNGNKFEYAYCSTTHLAQGSEYANGVYIEEPFAGPNHNNLLYTGITRFKRNLVFVTRPRKNYFFMQNRRS